MIPLKANFRVQVPKGTTLELFALKKPFASLISSDRSTSDTNLPRVNSLPTLPSQSDNLARGRAAARRRRGDQSSPSVSTERSPTDKPNQSPQSSRSEPSNAVLASLRSELGATRAELALLKSAPPYRGRRNKSLPPAPRAVIPTYGDSCLPPGMEAFLNKTDSWSGAQVIQAVQDLNSEILHLSAGATESVTIQGRDKTSQARMNQATKGSSSRLGVPFARLLASRDHSEEPALLQFGLQACVATCVARLLGVFCVGLPLMHNDLFLQIHSRMHVTGQAYRPPWSSALHFCILNRHRAPILEPQATSARWRALTLTHLRAINPRLEDAAVQDFITQILRAWADVLVLCGVAQSELTLDVLRPRFGAQTQRVVRSACALARILHEEIMSTKFEVILTEQGRAFDPSCMTNAFGELGESSGAVLCSTELGLRCVTKKNARVAVDGLFEGSMDTKMLLLPKVILEGVADVLDGKVSDE